MGASSRWAGRPAATLLEPAATSLGPTAALLASRCRLRASPPSPTAGVVLSGAGRLLPLATDAAGAASEGLVSSSSQASASSLCMVASRAPFT